MPLFVGELASRLLVKIFGSRNQRLVKAMLPLVEAINAREGEVARLSDQAMLERARELRTAVATERTRRGYDELMARSHALHLDRMREEAREVRKKAVEIERAVLDEHLVEAFAMTREASKRALGMRHYDVQMVGGMVLHQGSIAEMVTGEGKTLVATLPCFLNALAGHGVHVVTVNDFLARRDADWNRPIFTLLGMTVGAIQQDMDSYQRQIEYACDITYGTNNEFGFDYLRDNMKVSRESQAQGRLYYAIVDEVDSILIDEARTPLIISGQAEESTEKYRIADQVARALKKDLHFEVKEKEHQVILSEEGVEEAQRLVGVDDFYTGANLDWPHHIDQALKAQHLYLRDQEYVVEEGEVIIVDEHTGRKMPGRRWSDGLHQAVEAKEGLKPRNESQTLATVTLQNFFRLYDRLCGMTGTAQTEADELHQIYKLDVVSIPTNRPLRRENWHDVVYRTHREKLNAAVEEIERMHALGRPLLVGTASVERSEELSGRLQRRGIQHEVLNAKNHAREAEIIKRAGQLRQVTVATNMAGRGTDILLGRAVRAGDDLSPVCEWVAQVFWAQGMKRFRAKETAELPFEEARAAILAHVSEFVDARLEAFKIENRCELDGAAFKAADVEPQRDLLRAALRKAGIKDEVECFKRGEPVVTVCEAGRNVERYFEGGIPLMGGLHVLGTERHEARRIDNQLRGRCGRQGDPGSSQFFLSLQDDLMRIFAPDRVSRILERLGMTEGQEISHPMVTRAIERAQKKVEARNFDIRKNLLEYDQVMDEQRKVIYEQRQAILDGADTAKMVLEMVEACIESAVDSLVSDDLAKAERDYEEMAAWARTRFDHALDPAALPERGSDDIQAELERVAAELRKKREETLGAEAMRTLERFLLLQKIDEKWKDHLLGMDQLRSGVGMEAYAQKDPKVMYKKKGYELFLEMISAIQDEVTNLLYKVRLVTPEEEERLLGRVWRQAAPVTQGPPKTAAAPPRGGSAAEAARMSAEEAKREGEAAAQRAMERQRAREQAQQAASQAQQAASQAEEQKKPVKRDQPKVGRNDPCPCGSGKKFKKCCGTEA